MHKKTCTEDDPDTANPRCQTGESTTTHSRWLPTNRYQILMNVRNVFGKLGDRLYSAKVWLDVSSLIPMSRRPLNDRQMDVKISSESFHPFVGKIPHLL
ncbi:hypothetical protein NLK61_28270 [Pseudomonas fuscovaginae UPB0736]|uniref:hypothetical protein n=1 Tax=Pseudomonas asplenii TaxID=53407 RepID=UPI000288AE27|nr:MULTISPECIES: hypothetical protein [Pseudomonas]UUQ65035.1 hypothetical protein NLK61_28270 [Pseudomonas fuscovaginae UPB0736]UZE31731.1 hypothetical protein LOY63_13740 [Pseudomonas asplenii]